MITDEEAKKLVVRLITGDHICANELDDFHDWNFEHSTMEVAKLIQEAGKEFRKATGATPA